MQAHGYPLVTLGNLGMLWATSGNLGYGYPLGTFRKLEFQLDHGRTERQTIGQLKLSRKIFIVQNPKSNELSVIPPHIPYLKRIYKSSEVKRI